MCCFASLDKYRCKGAEEKTVVADLFESNLRSFSYAILRYNSATLIQIKMNGISIIIRP